MKKNARFTLSCLMTCVFVLLAAGSAQQKVATYNVGLSSVESPADTKKQFGETKVVEFAEDGVNKYRYTDDIIDITWYVDTKQFNFELVNKSNHTIKINWDDISYVDINGRAGRVMHAGVKYDEKNNSQPGTTIPKGTRLSDLLLPTDNVSWISAGQYSRWTETSLIPSVYKNKELYDLNAYKYIGKTMMILMPIVIENVQNDYVFTFKINELNPLK